MMSPEAWRFWDNNWFWILIFGGGFASWLYRSMDRVLRVFDSSEVKMARIESEKQIRLAEINAGIEDVD